MGTFTVTNTNDSGAGSLRAAIASANSTIGADTIDLGALSSTITLASTLSITDSVTLKGPGASQLAISGNNTVRVFDISGAGTVANLDGLTITQGLATGFGFGGGIQIQANSTLNLSNSIITDSSAWLGGGIAANGGTLNLSNSTVKGNNGGILSFGAKTSITNSEIKDNAGPGIYSSSSTLLISDSTIRGNSGSGGGIIAGGYSTKILNTTITQNTATSGNGGGFFNTGTATIENSTITNNSAGNNGGGISNVGGTLTVSNSTLSSNTSRYGGGLFSNSSLTVNNSTLSNNSATKQGGGILNNSGTLTVNGSTINANSAALKGGGIQNTKTATLTNSTISGNSAPLGGGFDNSGTSATLTHTTLTGNTASSKGGGLYQSGASVAIAIDNSIVAGNTSPSNPEAAITTGTFTSNGKNLVGQNGNAGGFTTVATDFILAGSISSALAPLANNGGPTATHALVSGGPAIDKGSNPNNLATDQRGFARVYGSAADIGAVEWQLTQSDPIPEAAIAISDRTQGGISDGTVQPLSFGWVAGATEDSGEVINQRTFEISNKGDGTLYLSDLRFEINLPSLPPGVAPADVFQIKFLSRNPIEPGAAALVEVALNPNLPPWFYRANFVVKTNVSSIPFYNFPVEAIVPKPPVPTVEEAVATLFPVPVVSGTAQGNGLLGSNTSEILQGFQGDDTVFGLKENDLLLGGQGNDQLFGGQGNDWLFGKEGDDVLYGDFGNDSLIGGEGKDGFVLGKNRGSDIIFDYEDGVDSFLLEPGLTFDQLSFSQVGSSVEIRQESDLLATVKGIAVGALEISDFKEQPVFS